MIGKLKPMVVLSNVNQQCATFFWKNNPNFYFGYRFIEHTPEILQTPLLNINGLPISTFGTMPVLNDELLSTEESDPWQKNWMSQYVEHDPSDNVHLSFKTDLDGSAWCCVFDSSGLQRREYFFEPVECGINMWMKVMTTEQLTGAFCVQQCLRMTGITNKEWRRHVALTPFLSEFDTQAQNDPNLTLTYARKEGKWLRFPVSHTKYHTPLGLPLLMSKSGGQIDHGLIVRESQDEKYCAGMYWERTAYVSNRHPADCIHASVDFGPLNSGEERTVHGKFYFIEGNKDELLKSWQSDFKVRDVRVDHE